MGNEFALTFLITNTGSIPIEMFTVYHNEQTHCIADLEPWQQTKLEIRTAKRAMLGFSIKYADREPIRYPMEKWILSEDDFQIVIEDDGKMFFR